MCVPEVLVPDEGESIWEGNTMHLPAASRVLIDITRHVKHFTVSFDYMAEEVIAKTTWRSGNNTCCPWHYGIGDVRSLADKAAATMLENVKVIEPVGPLNRSTRQSMITPFALCRLSSTDQGNSRLEGIYFARPKTSCLHIGWFNSSPTPRRFERD